MLTSDNTLDAYEQELEEGITHEMLQKPVDEQ